MIMVSLVAEAGPTAQTPFFLRMTRFPTHRPTPVPTMTMAPTLIPTMMPISRNPTPGSTKS